MKCPYCNNEMVSGIIQSAREFFFTTRPRNALMRFKPDGDDVSLSSHNLTSPTCLAYQCTNCKKIVIDYGEHITEIKQTE